MKIQIQQVAHHRNGISGAPFYAILFYPYRKPAERMFAAVFDEPGHVAIIRLDQVEPHGVTFGENSWRGDEYEPALRAAIIDFEAARSAYFKTAALALANQPTED